MLNIVKINRFSTQIFQELQGIKLYPEEREAIIGVGELWLDNPKLAAYIEGGLIKAIKSRKPNLLSEDI